MVTPRKICSSLREAENRHRVHRAALDSVSLVRRDSAFEIRVAKLQIPVFVINELSSVLVLKCVEDSFCGLSLNWRDRAERCIWFQAQDSLGGSPSPSETGNVGNGRNFYWARVVFEPSQMRLLSLFPLSHEENDQLLRCI